MYNQVVPPQKEKGDLIVGTLTIKKITMASIENISPYLQLCRALQATHRGTWIFFWMYVKKSILTVDFLAYIGIFRWKGMWEGMKRQTASQS